MMSTDYSPGNKTELTFYNMLFYGGVRSERYCICMAKMAVFSFDIYIEIVCSLSCMAIEAGVVNYLNLTHYYQNNNI